MGFILSPHRSICPMMTVDFSHETDGRYVLSRRLEQWRSAYDIILIDCPPNLGTLPINALLAADALIVPIQCEYYAMEGLGQILAAIQDLTISDDDAPSVAGILSDHVG